MITRRVASPTVQVGRRERAFTLIELLVVVTIIAVLGGLLMPVAVRAVAQSRTVHCQSNLSQLGRGLVMYASSSGLALPPFGYYTVGGIRAYRPPFWSETLAEFLYPSLPRDERLDKAVRCPVYTGATDGYSRGYACNYGNVFRYYSPGSTGRGPLHGEGSMRLTQIRRPSSTMFLMDGAAGFSYTPLLWVRRLDLDGDGLLDTYDASVPLYNGGAPFRHDGACVVVFADGHVRAVQAREWLTTDSLWDPFP